MLRQQIEILINSNQSNTKFNVIYNLIQTVPKIECDRLKFYLCHAKVNSFKEETLLISLDGVDYPLHCVTLIKNDDLGSLFLDISSSEYLNRLYSIFGKENVVGMGGYFGSEDKKFSFPITLDLFKYFWDGDIKNSMKRYLVFISNFLFPLRGMYSVFYPKGQGISYDSVGFISNYGFFMTYDEVLEYSDWLRLLGDQLIEPQIDSYRENLLDRRVRKLISNVKKDAIVIDGGVIIKYDNCSCRPVYTFPYEKDFVIGTYVYDSGDEVVRLIKVVSFTFDVVIITNDVRYGASTLRRYLMNMLHPGNGCYCGLVMKSHRDKRGFFYLNNGDFLKHLLQEKFKLSAEASLNLIRDGWVRISDCTSTFLSSCPFLARSGNHVYILIEKMKSAIRRMAKAGLICSSSSGIYVRKELYDLDESDFVEDLPFAFKVTDSHLFTEYDFLDYCKNKDNFISESRDEFRTYMSLYDIEEYYRMMSKINMIRVRRDLDRETMLSHMIFVGIAPEFQFPYLSRFQKYCSIKELPVYGPVVFDIECDGDRQWIDLPSLVEKQRFYDRGKPVVTRDRCSEYDEDSVRSAYTDYLYGKIVMDSDDCVPSLSQSSSDDKSGLIEVSLGNISNDEESRVGLIESTMIEKDSAIQLQGVGSGMIGSYSIFLPIGNEFEFDN